MGTSEVYTQQEHRESSSRVMRLFFRACSGLRGGLGRVIFSAADSIRASTDLLYQPRALLRLYVNVEDGIQKGLGAGQRTRTGSLTDLSYSNFPRLMRASKE